MSRKVHLVLQLRSLEQKHEHIGSTTSRSTALTQLREKESALQASAMQLFGKRAKESKEGASLQVMQTCDTFVATHIALVRLTDALLVIFSWNLTRCEACGCVVCVANAALSTSRASNTCVCMAPTEMMCCSRLGCLCNGHLMQRFLTRNLSCRMLTAD